MRVGRSIAKKPSGKGLRGRFASAIGKRKGVGQCQKPDKTGQKTGSLVGG